MGRQLLLLLTLCTGFALQSIAQQTTLDSIRVDGRYRTYRLYTPKTLRGTVHPLVINMHGLGSTAFEQEYYANFGPIADTAGFYVVMPQGTAVNGTTFWDVGFPGTPAVDDVRFIDSLISVLIRNNFIDPGRVYATGMSNGGFMSYLLALRLPKRIAAIASVTGGIVPAVFASATVQRPIPVMEIHGTADGTVPYTGSVINAPVDSVIAFFVRANGCSTMPVRQAVPDRTPLDGSTAEHFLYASPEGNADVELYRVNNGGHTWPGAPVLIGVTNQDFSASEAIWRFFSQYRVPALGVPAQGKGSTDPMRIFPNPVRSRAQLVAPGSGTVRVRDIRGICIATTESKTIDMTGFPSGLYLLQYTTVEGTRSMRFVKSD